MQHILFRGKRKHGIEWLFGDYNYINGITYIFDRNGSTNSPDWYEVDPETVGQYTGYDDKEGNKIFVGDLVGWRQPERSFQEHDGGYRESLEPIIVGYNGYVVFKNGCLGILMDNDEVNPILWHDRQWTIQEVKDAICNHKRYQPEDWFENKEEGDLSYLLESYKYENVEALLNDISGIQIETVFNPETGLIN